MRLASPGSDPSCRRLWIAAGAIVLAVVVVYLPAVTGGFIWDDDAHVTAPNLRSFAGLYRIWFDLGATQQYYPLLHSAFWVQSWLWGDEPAGYHAVNILLHAGNAVLVLLIVRRLGGPPLAAALAGGLFALHPVHVESVAWVTELKNTLSGAFYLSAMLVYLGFDASRGRRLYAAALTLFVLGLMTKTVTATLPATLLVIFWWQRGRLCWKRDALPLVPWFVLGAAGGLFTAWVEHEIIGAKGASFDLSAVERLMLAGRVVWFYLGKLIWPAELIFIYPRWEVDAGVWWQWLFPAALGAALVAAALARKRTRTPLAALLFFMGTLFPVLGFFNVYPFLFSYVADHFQYLASLGVIVPAAAGLAWCLHRVRTPAGAAVPLVLLGLLAWRQAATYADPATLYVTTIARNPQCWLAYTNLGLILDDQGRPGDAIGLYRRALELNPDNAYAHNNLGVALDKTGRHADAAASIERAISLRPDTAIWHSNLGVALTNAGRYEEAIERHERALALQPDNWGIHNNLALTYARMGRPLDALQEYRAAAELAPDNARVGMHLAVVYAGLGRTPQAIRETERALGLARASGDDRLVAELVLQLRTLRESPALLPPSP